MNLELDNVKDTNVLKDSRIEAINEALKFYDENKNNDVNKNTQNMINERRNQDKKLSILLRLRQ